MEYSLKSQGKNESVLLTQAIKNGQTLPDFVKRKPELLSPHYSFYLQCFNDLDSERSFTDYGLLPIPITKIIEYGRSYLKIETSSELDDFIFIMKELDLTVQQHNAKENEKARKTNTKPSKRR